MNGKIWMKKRLNKFRLRLNKMTCVRRGGEMFQDNNFMPSSESLATKDFSAGAAGSSHNGEIELKIDNENIEQAEGSLREGGHLNSEEARALLGRLEYQRGNIAGALRVFDGIDFTAVVPKLKLSISKRAERQKGRSSRKNASVAPPMSMNAVSLLIEAIFLKSKSLQALGRFEEAARSCNIVLDIVESAPPGGLPDNLAPECKVQEMISKAVELLPELWKLGGFSHEAVMSYRRVLLTKWHIDPETLTKIYKGFAIFLLYGGSDVSSPTPNLRDQMEDAFVPKNSMEEAILVLMILLRRVTFYKAQWDPTIIDHLAFALSVSGNLNALAVHVEELLPGVLDRSERYYTLALCYLAEGDDLVALNLLKILLKARNNSDHVKALLLAAKICGENASYAEGASFAHRALAYLHFQCDSVKSVAHSLLGINLSAQARSAVSDLERLAKQSEAMDAFEKAERLTKESDLKVIYNLALENAEQRKLDAALHFAKQLLRLEAGSNMTSWILLARILSAQKRYPDAEVIINTALEQTGKWDQGKLLRTKARIQIAQGKPSNAIETYSHLLALLQLRNKSVKNGGSLYKDEGDDTSLETETWHDLTNVYTSMSRFNDAQVCLSKLEVINPLSASRWHATGKLYEAKGLKKEAFAAYHTALVIEPDHVSSLVSAAILLKQPGYQSLAVARGYLTDALRIDRANFHAWYHLGMLYKELGISDKEAAECFQAATLLQDSSPAEPFR